ncbi:myoglobin-like [Biomphalaria glabrata]|uniref:Globin n=1 Tax=Biomphalaria glabrata TaxID=6526 RepID=A0A9W3ARV8_BIOGL|nr:myoglobin-like [Biomphalaria glabrata]
MFCCMSPDKEKEPTRLTDDQKRIIQQVWSEVRHQIDEVGVETFLRFFNTHPEAMDSFLVFKNMEVVDLETNVQLKEHALKVTSVVDKCVARINDPKSFETICRDQGINHAGRIVTDEFQRSLRDKYIEAIKARTSVAWSAEHQEAWETFFNIMQRDMMNSMRHMNALRDRKE